MFSVTDVGLRFLFWVSVQLKAEADMSLTAQRLRVGGWINTAPRPPGLETRVLRVKAGETFIIVSHTSGQRASGQLRSVLFGLLIAALRLSHSGKTRDNLFQSLSTT